MQLYLEYAIVKLSSVFPRAEQLEFNDEALARLTFLTSAATLTS